MKDVYDSYIKESKLKCSGCKIQAKAM